MEAVERQEGSRGTEGVYEAFRKQEGEGGQETLRAAEEISIRILQSGIFGLGFINW